MGGTLVVLAGDFRQTLLLISQSTPADELNESLKASTLWEKVQKDQLSTNMRIRIHNERHAQQFAARLLQIGGGTFPIDPQTGEIILTENLCQLESSIEQLIQKIYPRLNKNFRSHDWLCVVLAPKNIMLSIIGLRINQTAIASFSQNPGLTVKKQSIMR